MPIVSGVICAMIGGPPCFSGLSWCWLSNGACDWSVFSSNQHYESSPRIRSMLMKLNQHFSELTIHFPPTGCVKNMMLT